MTHTNGGNDSNSEYLAALGQRMLNIAKEWRELQVANDLNPYGLGLMRQVYAAIALELAVEGSEKQATGNAALLEQIETDVRSHIRNAVARI